MPVSYVVAVCTHPDYAGRGLMKEMLKEALRLARERGDVASLLLPAEDWLFDYYTKAVGYAPIFCRCDDNLPQCRALGV